MKADSFVFDMASLQHFDDAVTNDFNLQLQGIVSDCKKRPSCNKARQITLKVEAVPSEADADDVVLTCVVA